MAEDIRKRHVMEILDEVIERRAMRLANVLLQGIGQMFRFAAFREIVTVDPTFGIRKRDIGGSEQERTRVLSETEIQLLAERLPLSGLCATGQAAVWLLLATAARVGELSRARWSDIDLDVGTWKIPAAHAKNKRDHLVHLFPFAIGILKALKTDPNASEIWVYPSSNGKTHLNVKALQKSFRDRQRSAQIAKRTTMLGSLVLPEGEWRAHDLRRTAATLMGSLGTPSDVIERTLAHAQPSKLERTYQQQQLLEDRAEAFRVLSQRLELLSRVGSDRKVIPGKFRKAA